MMKSCKILNVARLLALALVAVLLIPACLPVAHAATATKLALLMEAEKYQYIEGDMFRILQDFIMVFSSFYFAPSQQAPSRPIPRRPCEVYARGCICQRSCLLQLLKRLQPMMRLMVS